MSEYIPLEIQEEILKGLPVKPLVLFRSVSKQWKSLIDSPKFIAAYGVRETHPSRLILRYKDKTDGEEIYLTFVDNDNDQNFIRQDFAPTVPDLIKTFYCSRVVGSSHGLLCFDGFYIYPNDDVIYMVVVWNPSTRKSIGIEVPYMHGCSPLRVEHVFGFGVCPVTFDPTIVHIEYMGDSFPWKVGVFTLSTGTWINLSNNLPRESIRLLGSQVVINRFIYWIAFDFNFEDGRTQSRYLIMSFDLTAKEFKGIHLTGSLTNQLCRIETISKLRESLVLVAYHQEFEEDVPVCCLWMMKENGVSRSFTKQYTINLPDATINTLLGFRKAGELILKTQDQYGANAQLQSYSPNSKAIYNLGIDGAGDSFFICSYMETLLLLDQLNSFIYLISPAIDF